MLQLFFLLNGTSLLFLNTRRSKIGFKKALTGISLQQGFLLRSFWSPKQKRKIFISVLSYALPKLLVKETEHTCKNKNWNYRASLFTLYFNPLMASAFFSLTLFYRSVSKFRDVRFILFLLIYLQIYQIFKGNSVDNLFLRARFNVFHLYTLSFIYVCIFAIICARQS